VSTGVDEVFIRPFTTEEKSGLTYQKSDIYIGINEIVSPEVVNRCITQLYENQEMLLDLIRN